MSVLILKMFILKPNNGRVSLCGEQTQRFNPFIFEKIQIFLANIFYIQKVKYSILGQFSDSVI